MPAIVCAIEPNLIYLCSRVVELSGLADGQSSGPEDEYLLLLRHVVVRLVGDPLGYHVLHTVLLVSDAPVDGIDEYVEEELAVGGTGGVFWMELDTENITYIDIMGSDT